MELQNTIEKLYLTVAEVARRLSVSVDTIYRWKRDGNFPKPVKLSAGCVRWRLSDVMEWESNLEAAFVTHLKFDFELAA